MIERSSEDHVAQPRSLAAFVVTGVGALLAAYGLSYGALNVVFLVGAALVAVGGIAEFRTRRALTSPLVALAIVAGFFVVVGWPTLSVPVCPPPPGAVTCTASGARERTLISLAAFAVAIVALVALTFRHQRSRRSGL